jgi:hypothetical protein
VQGIGSILYSTFCVLTVNISSHTKPRSTLVTWRISQAFVSLVCTLCLVARNIWLASSVACFGSVTEVCGPERNCLPKLINLNENISDLSASVM